MRLSRYFKQHTRIVCTLGPASSSASVIERLIKMGMNVARLNLSHGTLSEHAHSIQTVRKIAQHLAVHVAILIDLPGPKYRVGNLKGGFMVLRPGDKVLLTTRQVEGEYGEVPVNLPHLTHDIKVGDTVFLDDGAMQLKVQEVGENGVRCKVIYGGRLTPGRGVVVAGMPISSPFVTDRLRQLIDFAIEQQPDYVALSFVSSPDDVTQVKAILRQNSAEIPIIAKIERGQAVDNFDKILAVSDGIMVARGDLGVDIPLPKIPLVQKESIRKCNQLGKPVITATQMLESMISSPRPTRAEVTDVANAILDGTDAIMLSAETSIGAYPVEAVKMMAQITKETEARLPYEDLLTERGKWLELQTNELISYNACYTAYRLKAVAIVAFTQSGSTAQRVSKYRPRMPILAISPHKSVCGRLQLCWGVHAFQMGGSSSVAGLFATAVKLCQDSGLAKPGDLIVITGGIPMGVAGTTNLLKVERIPSESDKHPQCP